MNNLAPVMIPTLCRFEHFKRCIESLAACTWADNTIVYIGLDYPAKESHRIGYEQISSYLNENAKSLGFKDVVIIKRPFNYGANKNYYQLREQLFKIYDKIIFSEDDNEFGRNFLVYMNKGLELFKDDPKVFSVVGYFHGEDLHGYSHEFYFDYASCAWGQGFWREKYLAYTDWLKLNTPKSILTSRSLFTIHSRDRNLIMPLIIMYRKNTIWGDYYMSLYNLLTDKWNIVPTKSKVRNWGYDGSGVTCKKENNKVTLVAIDQREKFDYSDIEKTYDDSLKIALLLKKYRKASLLNIKFIGNLLFFVVSLFADVFKMKK